MALLMRMLRRRAGLATAAAGASILAIALSLWWNSQLSFIINAVSAGGGVPARAVLLACAAIAANSGAAWALGLLSGWTCETLAHDLRVGYARHFSRLSLPEIEELGAGEQMSRLQNEIADVSGFLRNNLFSFVDDGVRFAGTLFWMLWLDTRLTLLANLPVLAIMAYTVYSSKAIENAALKSQQANGEMGGFLDTLICAFPVVRVFSASAMLCSQYGKALKRWEVSSVREERVRAALMSLSALMSYLPLLLLILIGGSQVISGEVAIGTVYVFINLSGNVSGAMMNIPARIAAFRRFSANIERLGPMVSLEEGG